MIPGSKPVRLISRPVSGWAAKTADLLVRGRIVPPVFLRTRTLLLSFTNAGINSVVRIRNSHESEQTSHREEMPSIRSLAGLDMGLSASTAASRGDTQPKADGELRNAD